MLIECQLGPTEQTVGRMTYYFRLDGSGRAVCEVREDHVHIFLARARVYSVVEHIPDLVSQNSDRGVSEFRDSSGGVHATDHATAGQVSITKPRRGRRGIDDAAALAEMRQLLAEGTGLNNAAEAVAAKVTENGPRHQDAARKRLLRKHKDGKSR